MKALFYGASAASMAGLLLGMALKEPIAPSSSYGQQLLISHPSARAPSAFDTWTPTEGAPPAYIAEAATPSAEDVEQALARMTIFGGERVPERVEPVQMAHMDRPPEPEPYLPSRRGDILAPAAYSPDADDVAAGPPRSEPARWERRDGAREPEPAYDAPLYDRQDGPADGAYPPEPPDFGRGYR